MRPFTTHTGRALPLDRADVDTDQIVPAQHLKRVERTGFGPFLFGEWRKDPAFVLNDPRYAGASVLIAGPNFGSGSSREHAVWALEDAGFRSLISERFADIFRTNCGKIGLLPIELPAESVRALMDAVLDDPATEITVDLLDMRVSAAAVDERFEIDPYTRRRLLEGLDDIALTLAHAERIEAFEQERSSRLPSMADPRRPA
ncbi:MAG TPA: 3-isopropylmalate dehydratase small subunit [Actinomycetota bacterium]|nr:3-isopropylmalate dehydratase small subunit [Actinomycetota bacterium]